MTEVEFSTENYVITYATKGNKEQTIDCNFPNDVHLWNDVPNNDKLRLEVAEQCLWKYVDLIEGSINTLIEYGDDTPEARALIYADYELWAKKYLDRCFTGFVEARIEEMQLVRDAENPSRALKLHRASKVEDSQNQAA